MDESGTAAPTGILTCRTPWSHCWKTLTVGWDCTRRCRFSTIPVVPAPGFNHRWDESQYQAFKKKVRDYAGWARYALDLQGVDDQAAVTAWQKLFGQEFASVEVAEARAAIVALKSLQGCGNMALEPAAPNEEFVHDKARIERRYDARIDATIVGTIRHRSLRKARVVRTGRNLRFQLWTSVPEPYEVWWKVRNRGQVAERARELRGQITRTGSISRNAHTSPLDIRASITLRRTWSAMGQWSLATTTRSTSSLDPRISGYGSCEVPPISWRHQL